MVEAAWQDDRARAEALLFFSRQQGAPAAGGEGAAGVSAPLDPALEELAHSIEAQLHSLRRQSLQLTSCLEVCRASACHCFELLLLAPLLLIVWCISTGTEGIPALPGARGARPCAAAGRGTTHINTAAIQRGQRTDLCSAAAGIPLACLKDKAAINFCVFARWLRKGYYILLQLERMEELWERLRSLGFEDSGDGAAQLLPSLLAREQKGMAAPGLAARCVA